MRSVWIVVDPPLLDDLAGVAIAAGRMLVEAWTSMSGMRAIERPDVEIFDPMSWPKEVLSSALSKAKRK